MATNQALCSIHMPAPHPGDLGLARLNKGFPIGPELRMQYAKEILEHFDHDVHPHGGRDVRDWNFVLHEDGSVVNIAQHLNSVSIGASDTGRTCKKYPLVNQIPDGMIGHFDEEEKVKRMELFALGTLLYELSTLEKPFEGLPEEHVEQMYMKGVFPEDVWSAPLAMSTLFCWCPELTKDLSGSFLTRTKRLIERNPRTFALQVLGGAVTLAALITVPVLGAAGFAATGPIAGSAAAAWQASIGAVQAGSFFAWCQSAAMGGYAVGGIVAAAVSGATVAAGATAQQIMDSRNDGMTPTELKEMFLKAWARQAAENAKHATSIGKEPGGSKI